MSSFMWRAIQRDAESTVEKNDKGAFRWPKTNAMPDNTLRPRDAFQPFAVRSHHVDGGAAELFVRWLRGRFHDAEESGPVRVLFYDLGEASGLTVESSLDHGLPPDDDAYGPDLSDCHSVTGVQDTYWAGSARGRRLGVHWSASEYK
jgi:hypothetical protein